MRFLWLATGVGALVVGVVLVLATDRPDDYGWYAYTPLDDRVDVFGGLMLSRPQVFGAAIIVVGLLVIASGLGYLVGRRRR